ncbi:ADP-forming succinate--CoA ligase subunit beta [Vulgatibacter incomptus]|uniref:Succinate--CoA ligase [ADP-forming] subunit beta n=1 Tax=Vulgatibacter incomptus TaxID=1391653 RepID=A0A0K1PBU9_9BACT|nr:ADP-forming succinate--CoA ligase subunit beta [Vulgatibacter incomptus]AKU91013.1 Succinyl-CoA ligase [ADP-forming] beta chain [Vulgatibacter incomptus]
MKIHEYQGKEIFRKYGVPTPRGILATSPSEAEAAAKQLATPIVVVKSQVHAGGRGKGTFVDSDGGRGVRLAKSAAEARTFAEAMLGKTLVTIQTGAEGAKVHKLYVEEGLDIGRELYLGVTLDRDNGRMSIMASTEGGVEIEEVAATHPEKILKAAIDPAVGFQAFQGRQLAFGLGLEGPTVGKFVKFCDALAKVVDGTDAALVEVNPLVITKGGEVIALDAKLEFDDNALFRHGDLQSFRDPLEEDPREREAKEFDLAYISLSGNIGCMVNGAGLAMATMDIIQYCGGMPANFLDVGGGADAKKVTAAFKLILADPAVKAVFVNIFGGIMKCDVIADGVLTAAKEVGLKVPLVVRLEGTNVELGKKKFAESGMNIITADTMLEGAQKAVAAAGGK